MAPEVQPDAEFLTALDADGDPVPALMRIVERRLQDGEPRDGVLAALVSVLDEDPAPVSEALDLLTAAR